MSARQELPEVDEHELDALLAECAVTLRRLMLWGCAAMLLALLFGTLYLQAQAPKAS